MSWEKQVDEESVKVGVRREDSLCPSMLSFDVNQIAGCNLATLTCWRYYQILNIGVSL